VAATGNSESELTQDATIKQYLIVQTEGSRQVTRAVDHYNLQAIIAVGFKIENERAVQDQLLCLLLTIRTLRIIVKRRSIFLAVQFSD